MQRRSLLEQFERIGRVGSRRTNSTRRMLRTAGRRWERNKRVRRKGNGTLVPNRWQRAAEGRYQRVAAMMMQTVGLAGERRYLRMYTRFTFVLGRNRRGLILYSFTVTSHLMVTRMRARGVWIGKRRRGRRRHGRKRFGRFLLAGTLRGMILRRVPLERRGFCITCVSLSVRLFANMMAGHILLKVIGGFAWTMMGMGGRMYRAHVRLRAVLFRLMGLETGVAFVQAYVFVLLTCIYTTDVVSGGH